MMILNNNEFSPFYNIDIVISDKIISTFFWSNILLAKNPPLKSTSGCMGFKPMHIL